MPGAETTYSRPSCVRAFHRYCTQTGALLCLVLGGGGSHVVLFGWSVGAKYPRNFAWWPTCRKQILACRMTTTDGNITTANLLSLLNVSALKSGRKRIYEDAPTALKLNRRKTVQIAD